MSFPVQREELATLQFLIAEYFPAKDGAQAQAVLSRLTARAAIEARGVPDGWQPIETAPKDGTPILLATPKGRIADGNWHQKYGVWAWPYVMAEPTLWMPLPSAQIASAPPAPQAKPQPLSDAQIAEIAMASGAYDEQLLAFARAIEAAHGITKG